MKIKKKTFINLWGIFERLNNGVHPIKFSYFIAKNRKRMKEEIEILMGLTNSTDDYKTYDRERAGLANKLSDKDEKGNPIIQNGQYVIIEKQEEFQKQLKELQKKYKKDIEEQEKRIKEFNDILEEDVDFEGYQIHTDNLPEKIEPNTIELFMECNLINEE